MKQKGSEVALTSVVPVRWFNSAYRLPTLTPEQSKPGSLGKQVLVYPPFADAGCVPMHVAFYGARCTDEPTFYLYGRPFDAKWWADVPTPEPNACRICLTCGRALRRLNSRADYCTKRCRAIAARRRIRAVRQARERQAKQ